MNAMKSSLCAFESKEAITVRTSILIYSIFPSSLTHATLLSIAHTKYLSLKAATLMLISSLIKTFVVFSAPTFFVVPDKTIE